MEDWSCVLCGHRPGQYKRSFILQHRTNCVVYQYQAAKKAARLAAEAGAQALREAQDLAKNGGKKGKK